MLDRACQCTCPKDDARRTALYVLPVEGEAVGSVKIQVSQDLCDAITGVLHVQGVCVGAVDTCIAYAIASADYGRGTIHYPARYRVIAVAYVAKATILYYITLDARCA